MKNCRSLLRRLSRIDIVLNQAVCALWKAATVPERTLQIASTLMPACHSNHERSSSILSKRESEDMTARILPNSAELPEGFLYRPEFLSAEEEAALLRTIKTLEFGAYDFHGYIAKRRVVVWGEGYESGEQRMVITDGTIPEFLRPIRERAATVAGLPAEGIVQALVTEYSAGTAIGWHRDRPQFETIIGISLGSSARFRLKPYRAEGKLFLQS